MHTLSRIEDPPLQYIKQIVWVSDSDVEAMILSIGGKYNTRMRVEGVKKDQYQLLLKTAEERPEDLFEVVGHQIKTSKETKTSRFGWSELTSGLCINEEEKKSMPAVFERLTPSLVYCYECKGYKQLTVRNCPDCDCETPHNWVSFPKKSICVDCGTQTEN